MTRTAETAIGFDPRLRYPLAAAAKLLGVSRPWLYELKRQKKLRFIEDGRRRFVAGRDIEKLSRPPA
jgi:excisionase family DNA binding protein